MIHQPFVVGAAVAPVSAITRTGLNLAPLSRLCYAGVIGERIVLPCTARAARPMTPIDLIGAPRRLAHRPAEQGMPGGHRQHPAGRVPTGPGQEPRIDQRRQPGRRAVDNAANTQDMPRIHGDVHGRVRDHGPWQRGQRRRSDHRRRGHLGTAAAARGLGTRRSRPAASRDRDADIPATTATMHAPAGRRSRPNRRPHRRGCWQTHVATGAAAPSAQSPPGVRPR